MSETITDGPGIERNTDTVVERLGSSPVEEFGVGPTASVSPAPVEHFFEGADGGDAGFAGAAPAAEYTGPEFGDAPTFDLGDDDQWERNAAGQFIYNRDGSRRKRRGPRKGKQYRQQTGPIGSEETPRSNPLNIGMVESTLLSVHAMIAAMAHDPVWELDPSEARKVATAIGDVAPYFDFLNKIDPKLLAMVNLGGALTVVYGPRLVMTTARLREEKRQKAKPVGPQPNERKETKKEEKKQEGPQQAPAPATGAVAITLPDFPSFKV